MPGTEERLAAVEAHIREQNEHITMLLGIASEQGRDIKRIASTTDEHTEILKAIETAIQLLSGNITNMRTELLVIKALVAKEEE